MGLFVHEFFCSGAYAGELRQSSLAREGLAMLRAVLEDFAACRGCPPITTLDHRLRAHVRIKGIGDWAQIHWAESAQHERILFQKLAAESEATFVVAPESDGHLVERRKLVDRAGGRFLGHSADAIGLCADKLAFAEHLTLREMPTIPTKLFDPCTKKFAFPYPFVVKPRDGAGSQDTFLVRHENDLDSVHRAFAPTGRKREREAVVQSFVAGRSLSVAAIVDGDSGCTHVFPVGDQRLSNDGRFRYQGGAIPARPPLPTSVDAIIVRVCRSIGGLAGYIGFDLILPEDSPHVLVVEANPRLTTSYLGYRALANENLAARILQPARAAPIAWKANGIEFEPDGIVSNQRWR
jgi:predicted ATP-grasp superfamily ATP-dependent carboligase